ncbi:hypothetical protein [Thermococcus sp.]|uniref:hypothetical protein n=1 Tax=Thermococcus sp. TaxID=35749 RepID=UPI0026060F31|nr:hypothetical protein [Thermococcus sp.]
MKMRDIIWGAIYSALLSAFMLMYFLKELRTSTAQAIGLSAIVFAVFLAVWLARKETANKAKKALALTGLIAILSSALAPINVPFAVNTFITFTAGALALIYRNELLRGMPAFMYGWIGAGIGFILAIIVVPRVVTGDVERALALVGLMIVSMVVFLALGRKLHYRPFNRYSSY